MLVVGGGITGAGVALDAASRGLRVALVERNDFASGTSSKSSKLVHGGIRYLQQKEVRLVYEALAERQILRRTAPHLVRVLPFLLPVFTKDGLLPAPAGAAARHDDVDVRPHRRPAHRQAPQAREHRGSCPLHADASGGPPRGVVHLLRRADRRRPVDARDHPFGRRPRRGRGELRVAHRPDQGRAGPRHRRVCQSRRRAARGPRHHGRECHRRVGRRRRARSTKARTRRRSAPRRACTSPCRGRSCATRSRS